MLILIVEGLTCICTINYILVHVGILKMTHASQRVLFCVTVTSHPLCRLPSHHSQIKLLDGEDEYYKLLSTAESIPEEETDRPPSRPF